MTKIQNEVARLLSMVSAIIEAIPESKEAEELLNVQIPAIEELRATARKQLDETGAVTTEIYNATSAAMIKGENTAWALERDYQHTTTRMVCEQFCHVHVLMNEIPNPNPIKSHKCFPPGSEC